MANAFLTQLPITGKGGGFVPEAVVPQPPGSVPLPTPPPYRLGDRVTLVCDPGYTLPSTTTATVVDLGAGAGGRGDLAWEPKELHCLPVRCPEPPPPPAHGRFTSTDFHFPRSFGYACEEGFQINSDAWPEFRQRTNLFWCTVGGRWDPPLPPEKNAVGEDAIRCVPVPGWCPELQAPANCQVRVEHALTGLPHPLNIYLDDVARFRCDPDYIVAGSGGGGGGGRAGGGGGVDPREWLRTCQRDRTWSGEEATCVRLSCPAMDAGVQVVGQYGDLTIVDCGGGRKVPVKCLPIGRWSLKPPFCDGVAETDPTPNFLGLPGPPPPSSPLNPVPSASQLNPPPPPLNPPPNPSNQSVGVSPLIVPSIIKNQPQSHDRSYPLFLWLFLTMIPLFFFVGCWWWWRQSVRHPPLETCHDTPSESLTALCA